MIHMNKRHFTLGMTIALATFAALPQANAFSDVLQRYVSLCEQNVQCTAEVVNDGVLFRLRKPGKTEKLHCGDDGTCEVLLPRSARAPINDIDLRLATK